MVGFRSRGSRLWPFRLHPPKQTWFTWKWTLGKGDSYWKPPFPGSMLIFWGVNYHLNYHVKLPLNYHFKECFVLVPSILSKSKIGIIFQISKLDLPKRSCEQNVATINGPILFGWKAVFFVTIYMYEYRSKGPCVECSMWWPFVCQNGLWRKLKVEFAKVFFCESFAKVVRYDWNWLEHTWIFWRWCLYTAMFRKSLAKVLIKLGERRPSLES